MLIQLPIIHMEMDKQNLLTKWLVDYWLSQWEKKY
jgi:hypothetical protein